MKLAKVGGIGEANGIAGQLPIYLSSALDGPLGIAAAAHAAQALPFEGPAAGLAHGLATQLLFSATIAAARIEPRRRPAEPARRPRPRGRARRGGAGGSTASRRLACRRWTRPTATPRSPRRWSRSSAAAGSATRCSARARARPRWRWRCGASRRSTRRVIVDERSAGFFALGAAQATGTPVAVLCTSGTAAANLHPAVCEADEAGGAADRADRRPPAGAARDRRRADDRPARSSTARRCAGSARSAPTRPTTPGLLHIRSVACRAFCAAAGDPRPGPGAPERRLARPARPRAAPRRRDRELAAGARGSRGERPLTTVAAGARAAGPSRWSRRSPSASRPRRGA